MNATGYSMHDDVFVKKLTYIVLQNLNKDHFGVSELSKEAGISRSHLHRKLKVLKNQSISQFIRDIRLREAIKLLKNEDLTISEVAYRVGFSCPNYFHRCFQMQYGYAPGDIKKKKTNNVYLENQVTVKKTKPDHKQNSRFFSQKYWQNIFLVILVAAVVFLIYYLAIHNNNTIKSIAVLPLQNNTGETEQEFFVKGFHDALIGDLGQISGMRVISRTSTLRYEEINLPLNKIAKELGVDIIVEGSLFRSGNQVFIQVQLIDVFPKERHLWSKRYPRDFENIKIIQSDMVKSIAQNIHVTLTTDEIKLLSNSSPENPDAYKAYLKGIFHWDKLTEEGFNTAIKYFNLALEFDPDYSLAYAGISLVWTGRLQQGLVPYSVGISKLKSAAYRALELDNTLAEVHYVLGITSCWVDWNFEEAEKELKLAIASNPNYSYARAYLSHVLLIRQKPKEAMEQIELALKIDPFNPLLKGLYGMYLNFTGQYDIAIHELVKTLETDPYDPVGLSTLRTSYHMKKKYRLALEIWKTTHIAKGDQQAVKILQEGNDRGGYSCALENLAQLLIERSDTCYVTPWKIATLYTRAENHEEAIYWLEKAYDDHDNNMPYIGVDPIFDFLRDEIRFKQLLKKMGLPPGENPV